MADPLNPRLGPAELRQRLLRRFPNLSPEKLEALAAQAGYDLTEQPSEPPKKKLKLPPNWRIVNPEPGTTITIIGAPRSPAKRSP